MQFIKYLFKGPAKKIVIDYRLMDKYFQLHDKNLNIIYRSIYIILFKLKHREILKKYACDITPGWKLGGIEFRHPTGIVIGGGAELRDGVIIHQNVTLGALRFDSTERRGIPCTQLVKSNTIICAGAKVLGDVTIGENCIIGANAVVTKDVPDNTVVVGYNKHLDNKDTIQNTRS